MRELIIQELTESVKYALIDGLIDIDGVPLPSSVEGLSELSDRNLLDLYNAFNFGGF